MSRTATEVAKEYTDNFILKYRTDSRPKEEKIQAEYNWRAGFFSRREKFPKNDVLAVFKNDREFLVWHERERCMKKTEAIHSVGATILGLSFAMIQSSHNLPASNISTVIGVFLVGALITAGTYGAVKFKTEFNDIRKDDGSMCKRVKEYQAQNLAP